MVESTRRARPYWYLCAFGTLLAAAIVTYSQTRYAFSWDEGFHLLTAQLIKNGKRPYLDFFFPQTPLNAYWNAWWMKLFGDTWHTAHAAAGVCTGAAIMLTIDFVYTRFLIPGWQAAGGISGGSSGGPKRHRGGIRRGRASLWTRPVSNGGLLPAGPDRGAQPAIRCWPLLPDAWRRGCRIHAIDRADSARALDLDRFLQHRGQSLGESSRVPDRVRRPFPSRSRCWRCRTSASSCSTCIEYHAFHRQEEWDGAIQHDLEIMSNWVDSGQSLLLIVFGIAGLWYIRKKSGWERSRKGEFYLCAWIVYRDHRAPD